jgi:hypothetical protein
VSRAAAALAALALACAAQAGELRMDVGSNDNPLYDKECGSCHFAYQARWLPERSWRKLMDQLATHFGENAEVPAATREKLLEFLVANAADRSTNDRSREILKAIAPGDTPISITKVLYVGGIHGGFLDPSFKGKPDAKTLANCSLCHVKAQRGWFPPVNFTITDERFRTDDVDLSASLPVPAWMRLGK